MSATYSMTLQCSAWSLQYSWSSKAIFTSRNLRSQYACTQYTHHVHPTYPSTHPDLWSTARVPGLIRWMPSRRTSFPSRAAVTSGDGLQAVSPFGRVYLCCSKSLAVISWKNQSIRRIFLWSIPLIYKHMLSPQTTAFCSSQEYRKISRKSSITFPKSIRNSHKSTHKMLNSLWKSKTCQYHLFETRTKAFLPPPL